ATDYPQDLARRRLLLLRLNQLAVAGLELPQRFCQTLLKVVDLGDFVLRRLSGERSFGFRLPLRGLCTATHQALLASHVVAIRRQPRRRRQPEQAGTVRSSMVSATLPGSSAD